MDQAMAPVNLSVRINADAAQVWQMLRSPSRLAQWHGWQYDGLEAEIREIYFTDVVEDDQHRSLRVNGGDMFVLDPVDGGTELRIKRPPNDGTDPFYEDITEGWLTFLQQLRFALERHPQAARRTSFFSGRPQQPGSIIEHLELGRLPEPGTDYAVTASTGERLTGKVWFRSARQLGLTVDSYADHGQGLLIAADTPPNTDNPDGGAMVLISTYDLGAKDLAATRGFWDAWRQRHYPGPDPLG